MFNVFGVSFHLYGLIVGFAVVMGLQLIELRYKKISNPPFSQKQLGHIVGFVTVSALLGARVWHLITDWPVYQQNMLSSFYIWNGGVSILGAIVGGVLGCYLAVKVLKFSQPKKSLLMFVDLAVFGVPIAQAIGRFGNYVNQELYGLPTSLPWGIFIDQQHRVSGYEAFTHFHPLFAYEAILTAGFGLSVWGMYYFTKKLPLIGTGKLGLVYVSYYCLVRFFLEFLRIDKALFLQTPLGLNQVIVLITAIISIFFLVKKYE